MQRQATLREQSRQPVRSADEIVIDDWPAEDDAWSHGVHCSCPSAAVSLPGRALESATRFLIYSWRYGLIRPCACSPAASAACPLVSDVWRSVSLE
jgi:hypothetical protein